jgi:hypothetical protein
MVRKLCWSADLAGLSLFGDRLRVLCSAAGGAGNPRLFPFGEAATLMDNKKAPGDGAFLFGSEVRNALMAERASVKARASIASQLGPHRVPSLSASPFARYCVAPIAFRIRCALGIRIRGSEAAPYGQREALDGSRSSRRRAVPALSTANVCAMIERSRLLPCAIWSDLPTSRRRQFLR